MGQDTTVLGTSTKKGNFYTKMTKESQEQTMEYYGLPEKIAHISTSLISCLVKELFLKKL